MLKRAVSQRDELLTELRSQLTAATKEHERDAVVIDMARKELDDALRRMQASEAEHTAQQTRVNEMQQRFDAANARLETLQAQANAREAHIAELQQRLEEAERQNARAVLAESEYHQMQRSVQELRAQVANAEADHRSKITQHELAYKQASSYAFRIEYAHKLTII